MLAVLALALVGTLALAGCSLIGGTSAAPPTDPATVLQRVKSLNITDASWTAQIDGTSGGKTLAGGLSGHTTTNPARSDQTCSLIINGQQFSFEVIVDAATQSTYTYYTIPVALHTGLWVKQATQQGGVNSLSGFGNWNNEQDLTVVGPDDEEGINVWHLRGTDTSSGTPAQDDLYINQTDFRPVQEILKATDSTGSETLTMTIRYTAFNTGVEIDLPPPERVQSA
jgi:hypothetical protein